MIRKPTERDFKEGAAVHVLRETKRTAVESRKGVGSGLRNVSRSYLYGIFWLGILTTAVPAILSGMVWQGLLFIAMFYGIQQGFRKGFKRATPFLAGGKPLPPEPLDPADLFDAAHLFETAGQSAVSPASNGGRARQSGDFKLAFPVAMRQAMALAIPGLVLLLVSLGAGPFTFVPGIALLGTAILILFKAVADRDLLTFDHRSITVDTLLRKGTLDWDKVADVSARTYPRWNLNVLLTVGSRRVIVIAGRDGRNAPTRLLIPIDLLDLDKDGLIALIADLLCCRAAAGEVVPSWQQPSASQSATVTPASDPRETFDPDAIMARYLAERARIVEDVRPDLSAGLTAPPLLERKAFGRKVA